MIILLNFITGRAAAMESITEIGEKQRGEDKYQDVCVLLNKKTMEEYHAGQLSKLAPSTRNKLYVAITRARGNVYLTDESMCKV